MGCEKGFLMGVALLGAASTCAAAPLVASDILSEFNVVIADKFTSTADVEGRLVANEMTGGATFYNNPRGAASSFAAINAIKIDSFNANINNGGSVDYQTSDAAQFNLNGGGSISQSPSFAMTDFTRPLDALATQLKGLATNSTINAADPNNFTFNENPDATGTAVFNLTTIALASARNIVFSGAASTIIVNVTGSSFAETGNFNASAYLNQHIIWNFEDATSLSFTGWHGAVLAGKASVTNSSAMEGFLYAMDFTGNGELHDYGFAGMLPGASGGTAIPEPGSLAMLFVALGAMRWQTRRKTPRCLSRQKSLWCLSHVTF